MDLDRRSFTKAGVVGAGALAAPPLWAQAQTPAQPAAQTPLTPAAASAAATPLAPPDKQPADIKLPRPMRKAGVAVVGLGKLAVEEIMPAFGEAKRARPAALVSGHPDKARQVAEAYGMDPRAILDYRGYDRLRDRADVDIVYIVLPNSLHAEYTVRALEAGKHVLCEKPMAATSAECERMIAAARAAKRKLMIAYRLHYEPYNLKVMELCRARALGKIKTFASSNCQDTRAPNIRLSAALAGGPVGDTGIYSINAARYVIGEEPLSVTAIEHRPADDARFREVPESVVWTMRYPSGVLAHCESSFGTGESRRFRVHCADGSIDCDPAFSYRGQRLRLKRGTAEKGGAHDEELVFEPVNHFAAEMDHFAACVLDNDEVRTPGEMGLADMRIVEAIHEAARSGTTVAVRR